jgi:hypothetical protein
VPENTRRQRVPGSRVIYSLLNSGDGSILYINRSQEPAVSNPKKAEDEIKQYSRMMDESPRVMKMPRRNGVPDGRIVVWGKVTLELLDQESIKTLADRKVLKKGLLIDFLGNLARSAKAGLPIYRIDGGPGFVWAASFDGKGHGVVRLAAVDLSRFVGPTVEQQPITQLPGITSEAPEAPQPALSITTEKVQSEVTEAATITVEPEKTKGAPVSGQIEATKDEEANVEAVPAPLEAKSPVAEVSSSWETVAYEAIAGLLLVVLTACTVVICMRRHKTRTSKEQALQPRDLIEAPAQCSIGPSLSPDAVLARIEEIRRSSRRANESVLRVLASCRSGSVQLASGAIQRPEK